LFDIIDPEAVAHFALAATPLLFVLIMKKEGIVSRDEYFS
jgi:hypothetical protein